MRCFLITLLLGTVGVVAAASQWRGPGHDGVYASGPLTDQFDERLGSPVWQSNFAGYANSIGSASPVITDGKVYIYGVVDTIVDGAERTISERVLQRLGWYPDVGDEAWMTAADEQLAQIRSGRGPGKNKSRDFRTWLQTHATDDQRASDWARFRLGALIHAKYGMLTWPMLKTLADKRDHRFASRQEFEAWLKTVVPEEDLRNVVLQAMPKPSRDKKAGAGGRVYIDVIACFDLESGELRWQRTFPDRLPEKSGSSSTVCVADGRVFALGVEGDIYAFDAEEGNPIWHVASGPGAVFIQRFWDRHHGINGSLIEHEGTVFSTAQGLMAFDAATGALLWRRGSANKDSTPAIWRHADSARVLSLSSRSLNCSDVVTGASIWQQPLSYHVRKDAASLAVAGDLVAFTADGHSGATDHGLQVWRMSDDGAERIAHLPDYRRSYGSVVMHQGWVYAQTGSLLVSYSIADQRTATDDFSALARKTGYAAPCLADGRLFSRVGDQLVIYDARTGPAERIGHWPIPPGASNSSPSLGEGRLVLRSAKGVACYDLRP